MSHTGNKETFMDTDIKTELTDDDEESQLPMTDYGSNSRSLAVLDVNTTSQQQQQQQHPITHLDQPRYSRLNLKTPIPSDFEDNSQFNFYNITPQTNNFDHMLSQNGYESYIGQFNETGCCKSA